MMVTSIPVEGLMLSADDPVSERSLQIIDTPQSFPFIQNLIHRPFATLTQAAKFAKQALKSTLALVFFALFVSLR